MDKLELVLLKLKKMQLAGRSKEEQNAFFDTCIDDLEEVFKKEIKLDEIGSTEEYRAWWNERMCLAKKILEDLKRYKEEHFK